MGNGDQRAGPFASNLAALGVLRRLEDEDRAAGPAEQELWRRGQGGVLFRMPSVGLTAGLRKRSSSTVADQ